MEKFNNLPKVTQTEKDKAKTQTQFFLAQNCALNLWLDPKHQLN